MSSVYFWFPGTTISSASRQWVFAATRMWWIVFLIPPAIQATELPLGLRFACWAALGIGFAAFLVVTWPATWAMLGGELGLRVAMTPWRVMAALISAVCFAIVWWFIGEFAFFALVLVMVMVWVRLPAIWGFLCTSLVDVVCAIVALVRPDTLVIGFVLGLGITMVACFLYLFNGWARAKNRWMESERKIADWAVTHERERIARDMHEILGRSLMSLTRRAELLSRLADSGDREAIKAESGVILALARSSSSEIRGWIHGVSGLSLSAELANARSILLLSDIQISAPSVIDNVEADLNEPLAFVLREAVTNIVRHSMATRVVVTLSTCGLTVEDNGEYHPIVPGHGLHNLSDRMAQVGGELMWGASRALGGFCVSAQRCDSSDSAMFMDGTVQTCAPSVASQAAVS